MPMICHFFAYSREKKYGCLSNAHPRMYFTDIYFWQWWARTSDERVRFYKRATIASSVKINSTVSTMATLISTLKHLSIIKLCYEYTRMTPYRGSPILFPHEHLTEPKEHPTVVFIVDDFHSTLTVAVLVIAW